MINVEQLKQDLIQDGLFRRDGGLNTAWIHNRSQNYDFSELEGDTLQEKLYLLFHKKSYCSICGKPSKFVNWSTGYRGVCSKECKREFDRKTLREKAVPKVQLPETREKRKKTCIQRYGVNNPFKATEIKEKIVQTNIQRLGVAHPAQNKAVLKKMEITNRKHHGGLWNAQTKEHREKLQAKRLRNIETFEKENNCTQVAKIIQKYGQGWLSLGLPFLEEGKYKYVKNNYLPQIQQHYDETLASKTHAESEIITFCRDILPKDTKILQNCRSIIKSEDGKALELDIYIPSKKIAIEFNGIYWHSFQDKNYHLHKTQECEKLGIRLLHLWEDLWITKKDIYKSIIASALGIYQIRIFARQCEIRTLTSKEYREFLERNHIQGAINSSLRLGLFYKGELVQVTGWGKSRFKNTEYELHRMCSALNTQIIGGFSKLIAHSNLESFVSYIDRSLYSGEGYKAIGFQEIGVTEPGYFYSTITYKRVSRIAAQKHKLSSFLENYDSDLSEAENMRRNNYYRNYDCGNWKVLYKKNSL